MAKKIKPIESFAGPVTNTPLEVETVAPVTKALLTPLTLDYPHEYLNDMGRKINQIIEHLNA